MEICSSSDCGNKIWHSSRERNCFIFRNGYTDFSRMSDEVRTGGKMVEDQLLEAIQKYDLQTALEMLAKNGSALSRALYEDNNTALHWAAMGGQLEIVQELIRLGANVGALNDDQEPPLFWASTNGNRKVMDLLLESGASVDVTDVHGKQLYHHAVASGNISVVNWTHKHANKLSIDNQDASGRTPLTYACQKGDSQMTEWLITMRKASIGICEFALQHLLTVTCAPYP